MATRKTSAASHVGKIRPLYYFSWLDTVRHDREGFTKGLKDLGLSSNTIKKDLEFFDDASYVVRPPKGVFFYGPDGRANFMRREYARATAHWKSSLRKWLGLREYRVEDSTKVRVRIPIFKLHSPRVQSSKVSYLESTTDTTEAGWSVEILGSGMGARQGFSVKYTNTFDSTNGSCKLIFVPVTMKVDLVDTYHRGKCIGRGLRSEVVNLKGPKNFNKAIASIPESECAMSAAAGTSTGEEEFDFSADVSSDIHKVEWVGTWDNAIESQVGINAFKLESKCKTTVTHKQEIGLAFELPAGHRYTLRQFRGARGITWDSQ